MCYSFGMRKTMTLMLDEVIIEGLDREARNASTSRSSIARVAMQAYLNARSPHLAAAAGQVGGGIGVGPGAAADHSGAIIERAGTVPHIAVGRSAAEAVALADERGLSWAAWGLPHQLAALMPPPDATACETRDAALAGTLARSPGWHRCAPQIVRNPIPKA